MRQSLIDEVESAIAQCRREYPELVDGFERDCREFLAGHPGDTPEEMAAASMAWGQVLGRHGSRVIGAQMDRGFRQTMDAGREIHRR
jgi:hypothetical protein